MTTLFHEFGHGLHHMLTQVDDIGVSGISGVEWDAVELPSQFMENFCWEWDVLRRLTAHVDTGEPLPRALFDKMLAAKNFQSGLQTLRQVEFSLFDMRLHAEPGSAAARPADARRGARRGRGARAAGVQPLPAQLLAHLRRRLFGRLLQLQVGRGAVAPTPGARSRKPTAACSTPTTGRRYREAILEAGGSRPAMDSFKAFRGREPRIDALLRHQGMGSTKAPDGADGLGGAGR